MKYLVLKNLLDSLYLKLPDWVGNNIEFVWLESDEAFSSYLDAQQIDDYEIPLHQTVVHQIDGFFVRQADYMNKIRFSDILWVEASRSYSYLHLADNKAKVIVTHPLSEVKKKLPQTRFIQIHRSFIVNICYVERFIGNMLYIGKVSFPISRKYRNEVMKHFIFLDTVKEPYGKENSSLGNHFIEEEQDDLTLKSKDFPERL